ncbi:MAG: cyclic nucleotide-binding domain-containing protein [Rhodospirillales bacterium]
MASEDRLLDVGHDKRRGSYASGEALWRKGDPANFLCLIVSGEAALYHVDEAGNETFVANFGPGQMIGEAALYGSEPRETTVKAAGAVEVTITTSADIRARISRLDTVSSLIIKNLLAKMKLMASELDHRAYDRPLPAMANQPAPAKGDRPGGAENGYDLKKKTYKAGEVLWRKGDPSDGVLLIVSGRLSLYHVDADGNEDLVADFTRNRIVGENALYDSMPRSTVVKATEDTEAVVTNGEELRGRIASYDTDAAVIIQNLLIKMKMMEAMLDIQVKDGKAQEEGGGDGDAVAALLKAEAGAALSAMGSESGAGMGSGIGPGMGPGTGAAQRESSRARHHYRRLDVDDGPGKKKKSPMAAVFVIMMVAALGIPGYIGWKGLTTKVPVNKRVVVIDQSSITAISMTMEAVSDQAIRSQPSAKSQQVGRLEAGGKVKVTGKTVTGGAAWYRIVRYGGKHGYVPETALK